MAQNQDLLQGMMGTLRGEEHDAFTQEMVLGALQKLSLRYVIGQIFVPSAENDFFHLSLIPIY